MRNENQVSGGILPTNVNRCTQSASLLSLPSEHIVVGLVYHPDTFFRDGHDRVVLDADESVSDFVEEFCRFDNSPDWYFHYLERPTRDR